MVRCRLDIEMWREAIKDFETHRTQTPRATIGRRWVHRATLALALCAGPGALVGKQAPSAPSHPPPLILDSESARPDPATGRALIAVPEFPDISRYRQVGTEPGAATAMVNRLYLAGKAAGLGHVIYDNRDADHSRLDLTQFPQLRETRYAPEIRRSGRGLAGLFQFDTPVIGNASLALTKGPFARSLPRAAMQSQVTARTAYELYASNHLYVYPEHRDHDRGRSDRFLAQTPYMVISQGSSFSDRPFVKAFALTFAAFSPDTFDTLRANGLLPATTQMIMRRTRSNIRSAADYLSPDAHPTAFEKESLRPAAMVALAAAIRADQVPPMVHLEVVRDLAGIPGVDFLSQNLSERLFTTPGAIARIWRSFSGQRRMVVTAERTTDPNGHPLTFEWVVLRGNPDKVRIATTDPNQATAEISVDWHSPDELTGPGGLPLSRIEIGVFAHNGFHHSAPAFISLAVPLHQNREYAGQGDAARLWRLTYDAASRYVDPLVWPVAQWDDRLAHGPDGRVEVLTRKRADMARPYALHHLPSGGWTRHEDGGPATPPEISHVAQGPPDTVLTLTEVDLSGTGP